MVGKKKQEDKWDWRIGLEMLESRHLREGRQRVYSSYKQNGLYLVCNGCHTRSVLPYF